MSRCVPRARGASGLDLEAVHDCTCHSIILGENFDEAVDARNEELGVPVSGFETYGELCMERGQMSGYHDTTSVVMFGVVAEAFSTDRFEQSSPQRGRIPSSGRFAR